MSTTSNMQKRNARAMPTPQTPASACVTRNTNDKMVPIFIAIFNVILLLLFLWSILNPSNIYALVMRCYSHITVYLDLANSLFTALGPIFLLLVVATLLEAGSREPAASNTQFAKGGHERARKEVSEPVVDNTPVTHDLHTPDLLLTYPPLPEFPFNHFHATGESFRHHDFSQPLYPMPLPCTYPRRDSHHDEAKEPTDAVTCTPTKDDKTSGKETLSDQKDTKPAIKASKVSFMDVVVAKPDHKAVEQPPQPTPLPIHTPIVPATTTSSNTEVIQTPVTSAPTPVIAQAPPVPARRAEIIQVGLPAVEPSLQDMQIGMLELVAGQEFKMETALDLLFIAFMINGAYDEPALLILSMMEEAKANLLPLFPNGLTGLNTDRLIWANSLLTFWEAPRPYGYEFQVHPDEDIRIFLIRYHDFICWMGLGHLLRPFIVTALPAPEPIQAPPPPPAFTIQHPTPPVSFQAPSFSAPAVPQPAPEPIQAPPPPPPVSSQSSSYSTQAVPKPVPTPFAPCAPVSFEGLSFSTKAVPKPAPTAFASCAPVSFEGLSFSTKAVPKPAPTPFAPCAPVSFQGLSYSTKTVPNPAPKPVAPAQAPPTPQPQAAQHPPGLLNFEAFDWLNQSDDALNALTSESFQWPSPQHAAYKLWSYSTVGQLRLPAIDASCLNRNVVKAELNKVAPIFKRACVILHLQKTIISPHEDDLAMVPLLGEVQALLEAAEKMTNDCDDLVVYDDKDEWYHACMYFGDSIISSGIINRLRDYRSEMRAEVKEVWGRMKAEWVGDTSEK
ncbi:hypothetical protein CFE70_000677 [Pyrenophora teres f. teres 0-1]|uniref:Uncharacterized protein n=1 Tax=Pyrenophora teres f. teres (strain 0-1) TaxID=861557 RepID=E3S2G4_PYRTT|nr:hypothetical protein PTT_16491 [Pyrenophora teres f. teres 0-1]